MMATGFIGLGDMGAPIAHRLLDGCIELVAGTDGIYDMMVKEMWNAVVLSKTAHIAVPLTSLGVQVSRGMLERRAVDIEAAVT